MPFDKEKINNLVVKGAPKWGGDDPRPPRGEQLFKTKGCNVYISAKKHSGKTSNLFFILRKVMGPKTTSDLLLNSTRGSFVDLYY